VTGSTDRGRVFTLVSVKPTHWHLRAYGVRVVSEVSIGINPSSPSLFAGDLTLERGRRQ